MITNGQPNSVNVYSGIEDLTRKTGNFKQFSVFCSMLESAVKNVSFFEGYLCEILTSTVWSKICRHGILTVVLNCCSHLN